MNTPVVEAGPTAAEHAAVAHRIADALRVDLPGKGLSADGHRLLDLTLMAADLISAPRPQVVFAVKQTTPGPSGMPEHLNGQISFLEDPDENGERRERVMPLLTIYLPVESEAQFEQTLRHEVWHYRQQQDGRATTGPAAEAECNAFAARLAAWEVR